MIASTDLPLGVAVAIAVGLAAASAWYWRRLERPGIPEASRRLRRFSILLSMLLLPGLVWCSAVIDHRVDPVGYVTGWVACMGILLLIVLTAVADVLSTMVLHRRERRRLIERVGPSPRREQAT